MFLADSCFVGLLDGGPDPPTERKTIGVILGGRGIRTPLFGVGGRTLTLQVHQVRNFARSPYVSDQSWPLKRPPLRWKFLGSSYATVGHLSS